MIYKILTRLLIVLSINSCAQEYKKEYYDNGQIKETGKLLNGKKEGLWKEFYETGKVKATTNYKKGIRLGDFIVYHENGVVAKKGKLIKDTIAVGKWEWFYESKQLKREGVFDNEGNQIGKWKVHHKNGKLMIIGNFPTGNQLRYFDDGITIEEKGFFKGGLKDGTWEMFYRNGKPRFLNNYKKGLKDGISKIFHENGKLDQKGFWVEGEAEGEWKNFGEEGNLERHFFYKKGEELWSKKYREDGSLYLHDAYIQISKDSTVKTFKKYYYDGKLKEELKYDKEGKYLYKEYFENGNLFDELKENEKGEYVYSSYYSNGQLEKKVIYKDIDRYYLIDGNWKEFHENGNIAKEFSTKNGIIVGTHKSYFTKNKQLEEIVNYNEKGEEIGEKKVYYENGNLAQHTSYDAQGGKYKTKTFHENGNIAEEFSTKNGRVVISKEYSNSKSNHLKSISYFDENGKYQRTDYYKEDGTKLKK